MNITATRFFLIALGAATLAFASPRAAFAEDAPAAAPAAEASATPEAAKAAPGLALDGALVEAMSPRGVELIVGARNDPDWGAIVLVGMGGVAAEALKDVRVLPAELDVDAIAAEISALKGAALLRGFRGDAKRDIRAAAEIAAGVGRFVAEHPEVREIDINPVLVLPEGEGALALDALIEVGRT